MGMKLPEGALQEERLRKIESRLDALEKMLKGDVEPVIESEQHSSENETPEEDQQEEVKSNPDDAPEVPPEADTEPATESEAEEPADTKQALVEKALSLKENNPKAVKAAPSQIPLMSVEKLSTLIEEAEAVIASQDEE